MFPKSRSFVAPAIRMPRAVVLVFAVTGFMAFTGGPAIANHVTCGDLITEDTILDADLTCDTPGVPALTIAADGVTLDLGGHMVVSFESVGVLNDGHDGVTIRNGRIGTPAPHAIVIRHANGNRLEGLGAGGGGGGPGALLDDSDDSRVVRSSFGGDIGGLRLTNGSDRNVIERNSLRAGIGSGLFLRDSDDNVVRRNSFGNTETAALRVYEGSDNTAVIRNELRGGGVGGFGEGLVVSDGTTNTLLVRNQVSGYMGQGFLGYFGNGIRVESASTTLTRNTSNDNLFWGILAVPGVIDGGHNTASGNGAGQCQNVSC